MALLSGSTILASDYNNPVGATASSAPYASSVAALSKLAALYGVGYGQSGYGQTAYALTPVTNRTIITSSQWQSMRSALLSCATHVGRTFANLPDAAFYSQGGDITADPFDWLGAVQVIESVKLSTPASTILTIPATSTRTTRWTGTPVFETLISFASEDQARHFFNSGGKLSLDATLTAPGNAQSTDWQTLLANIGTVSLGAVSTTQTGTGGQVNSSVGYYTLVGTPTTMFTQYSANDPYKANFVAITAQRESYTGANGGNGSQIRLTMRFADIYGGLMDYVEGTLQANLSVERAGGTLTIAAPSVTTEIELSAGGTPPVYVFRRIIDTNTDQYNVLADAVGSGYNLALNIPLAADVTVQPNVICGSSNAGVGGFNVPALLAGSSVVLTNYGYIVGRGGNGGTGNAWGPGSPGENGGWGIGLAYATIIKNYGIIGGGGGGGGGSTAWADGQTYDDPGGGGGGGAGSTAGNGVNSGASVGGAPGSLLSGGAGGSPQPHGGSKEWWKAYQGGRGGDLGQPGAPGQGPYGGGLRGEAGYSIVGNIYVLAGSILGDIRGPTV